MCATHNICVFCCVFKILNSKLTDFISFAKEVFFMSILLLEAKNIKKSFGDKLILDIKEFRIYSGDRIGFIGENGCGKTTLLNILVGVTEPDEGETGRYCETAYIEQFGEAAYDERRKEIDAKKLSEYKIKNKIENVAVSGGEATRIKLAKAMSGERRLVFADEPTSNLDMEGIELFCGELSRMESFVLVSHDRDILSRFCNKIMTLENQGIVMYEGGFEEYQKQITAKKERAMIEYEQYTTEKERLQKVYSDKKAKAAKVARKPKGMSSSEQKQRDLTAVHRSNDGRQRSFESAARNVQARIEHMEVKEKPRDVPRININFQLTEPPANKTIIAGKDVCFSYGNVEIFKSASFSLKNGSKTAVYGENGSGKTTLFNMIANGDPSIYRVPKARIGYFYQGFENIDFNETILANTMSDSIQNEAVVRAILARLLFRRDDVHKSAGVLSGGERIRLSLAKLLVSKINVLMLDEPTNYLDMKSIEVLQSILIDYEGTVLFVSHDRAFVNTVCTNLLVIKDKKILSFEGNLDDYENKPLAGKTDARKMILELKLAELAGKIARAKAAEKEALEAQYREMLNELKRG